MTTPYERTRAVLEVAKAIGKLRPMAYKGSGSGRVTVDQQDLQALILWLRHYPMPSEIALTAAHCPHLWADPERTS